MGNKWFKSENTSKDVCTIEELGDRTESKEDDFIQTEYNGGQSGDDVLPGCFSGEGMAKKETLDKKGYQEQTIELQEDIEYISHVKQKKDKKPYLHPLKVWHFLDSERESNITGATITRDRRIVFADHDNCSLKAYGLKVTNHFRIIRKRECRRSYVHLTKNINGRTRRYRPFDLCEYEKCKLIVTTGQEKVLLFVDLEGKKIERVKETEHVYRGICKFSSLDGRRLIAVSFGIGGVCILDTDGNIKQKLNCPGILHEPVYISGPLSKLYLTNRQNDRIAIIDANNLLAYCISIKPKMLNSSDKNMLVDSLKGLAVGENNVKETIFVCDSRIKSVRRFETTYNYRNHIELPPIKVGKEIQCIIYDNELNELYICSHGSNHALIWKRGGFVREVMMKEPQPLIFSSPVNFTHKPKLNKIAISSNASSSCLAIAGLAITLERKLVVCDRFHNRLLVYDLKSEESKTRSKDQPNWSEMKLKAHTQGKGLLYKPLCVCVCEYDTNILAVTTGKLLALLLVDIEQKQINEILNVSAEYSYIIYHRNKFIVYRFSDGSLCFLNKNGVEVKRIFMRDYLEVVGISRLGDTLFIPECSDNTVLSISRRQKKVRSFQPDSSGFSEPSCITTDDHGIVYICDTEDRCIRRFNYATKEELPSIDVRYKVKHIAYDPGSERLYLSCCFENKEILDFLIYTQIP